MRLFLIALLVVGLVSLSSATMVLATLGSPMGQSAMMGSGNMGGSGGMMGASGTTNNAAGGTLVQPWLDLAGVFLIILGSALVMVWAFRQVVNPNHQNNEQPPLLLLQRRYARGEIGAEDFNRMRADLLQDRSTV